MSFEIFYFADERGKVPVRDYLFSLPEKERAKVAAYITYLSEEGPRMRRPHADYLGDRKGLYELRPGRHRIIYFFFLRNKIILLHSFMKKTDAIPQKDIEIALRRKEIVERNQRVIPIEFESADE
jgi:phage-related protein